MSQSILLIHPDGTVRQRICDILSDAGFVVAENREFRLTDIGSPDLILIEWRALSPVSESLHWLKQNPSAPALRVIVLAEGLDYMAAVRLLESGVDDCVRLPLQGSELLIRVNASLHRPHAPLDYEQLSAGPIVLDRRMHRVQIQEQTVDLAPTEFRLLAFLLENKGRVFSRNELLRRAWSSNVKAGHRTVDVHVRRLRQQLEPYRCDDMIQTVRGFGYRLRAESAIVGSERP